MTDKKKLLSYVLNQDPDLKIPQIRIAQTFEVTQPTIATAIKEVKYQKQINDLQKQLDSARQYIDQHYTELIPEGPFERITWTEPPEEKSFFNKK